MLCRLRRPGPSRVLAKQETAAGMAEPEAVAVIKNQDHSFRAIQSIPAFSLIFDFSRITEKDVERRTWVPSQGGSVFESSLSKQLQVTHIHFRGTAFLLGGHRHLLLGRSFLERTDRHQGQNYHQSVGNTSLQFNHHYHLDVVLHGVAIMPSCLVPLADGSEELEAISIWNPLRRAGVDVTVASVSKSASLEVTCARGTVIKCDKLLSDCLDTEFDCIALPGGMPGASNFAECAELVPTLDLRHPLSTVCFACN